ncbi:MAG: class III signal peptide-containing protein [Methanobacteriaceae archaeon]|nr:class III signal peptide-containing protein [Methanobacteriaceae archaeon]
MNILKDEKGQGAAEYILLFGGVIVIAIVAISIYTSYFKGQTTINSETDMGNVRANMTSKLPQT